MVASAYVDPLDVACHTGLMSEVRPRLNTEMSPQEVRFTARDPLLDESLARLEVEGARQEALARKGEPYSDHLPENLFLFAEQHLGADMGDAIDGFSQNLSTYTQYRQGVSSLANRGIRRFTLDPWIEEVHAESAGGVLTGVLMRVRVDQLSARALLAPPFSEPEEYQGMLKMLRAGSESGENNHSEFVLVRYSVGQAVEKPQEQLERLSQVLKLGSWVSQLAIVPSSPATARNNDIFRERKRVRTYAEVGPLT